MLIRAARRGGARFAGHTRLHLTGAAHVTVEGMTFAQDQTLALTGCHHVRLTRNLFQLREPADPALRAASFHWTLVQGAGSHHNRIDHNRFETKRVNGHFVAIEGSREPAQVSQHDRIDHNHFRDVGPFGEGMETIRIGLSRLSMSSGYTVVEDNLFESCSGDLEIVSVKSCDNVVRYNTIVASEGALTARHGHRNHFIGNVVFGRGHPNTGGVRVRLVASDGLFKLSSGSPAIDRARGSFTEVIDDLDGQPRKGRKDVGADEYSRAPVRRRPLTAADVGVDAP